MVFYYKARSLQNDILLHLSVNILIQATLVLSGHFLCQYVKYYRLLVISMVLAFILNFLEFRWNYIFVKIIFILKSRVLMRKWVLWLVYQVWLIRLIIIMVLRLLVKLRDSLFLPKSIEVLLKFLLLSFSLNSQYSFLLNPIWV